MLKGDGAEGWREGQPGEETGGAGGGGKREREKMRTNRKHASPLLEVDLKP